MMPKQHSEWRPAHTNFVPRSLILYGLASLSSNPLGSDRPSKRVNPATVSQTNHALHTTWHGCRSTAPVAEHRMNSPFGDQCWASEALLTGYHAQPTVRYSLLKGIKAFISIYLYIYIINALQNSSERCFCSKPNPSADHISNPLCWQATQSCITTG